MNLQGIKSLSTPLLKPGAVSLQPLAGSTSAETVRFRGRVVGQSALPLGNSIQNLAAALQASSGTALGKDAGPALFRRF
jgi:hypothetical protein